MQVFKTVEKIQSYLNNARHKDVGFVATMGALHQGHLSLIALSKNQNDLTICSIFVNPKQFNKKEDLIKYPRKIDSDLKKLEEVNCDVVFIPNEAEMYPNKVEKNFHFGPLSEIMEGKHRPGHFNGVAIVIDRFFEILTPTRAYFGEKDYQQLAVIRALVKDSKSEVEIVGCPIYRENNGLAMSSRNERLSEGEKEIAGKISKALAFISHHKKTYSILELKKYFWDTISKEKLLEIEYFEIVDKKTMKVLKNWEEGENFLAFTAVNLGDVRLIDNMTIIN